MVHPLASFTFISSFQTNICNKYMWKNAHPVYCAGIRTHDLQDMRLLSQLDQGSRPTLKFVYDIVVWCKIVFETFVSQK